MRAALYARVSTKDGRQDTDNQLRQLLAFAKTQSWTVIAEYVDHASGKHSDREQFELDVRGGIPAGIRLPALLEPR